MPKINWKEYNEKLVRRVKFYSVQNYRKLEERGRFNERKEEGHPYQYPNPYMQFLISILTTDYKAFEGFCSYRDP